jgi:hypothetical protein
MYENSKQKEENRENSEGRRNVVQERMISWTENDALKEMAAKIGEWKML